MNGENWDIAGRTGTERGELGHLVSVLPKSSFLIEMHRTQNAHKDIRNTLAYYRDTSPILDGKRTYDYLRLISS